MASENPNSPDRPKLSAEFAQLFLDSAIKTFEIQCEYKVNPGKPFALATKGTQEFAIMSSVGLTSPLFTGAVTLGFEAPVYLTLIGNMLGEQYTKIDEGIVDGAGELLNIIFGTAKSEINKRGHQIQAAIPSVSYAQGMVTKFVAEGPTIIVPFESEKGALQILITINQ